MILQVLLVPGVRQHAKMIVIPAARQIVRMIVLQLAKQDVPLVPATAKVPVLISAEATAQIHAKTAAEAIVPEIAGALASRAVQIHVHRIVIPLAVPVARAAVWEVVIHLV